MFGGMKKRLIFAMSKYRLWVVTPDITGFFCARQHNSVVTLRINRNSFSKPVTGALTAGSAALLFFCHTRQKPNVMTTQAKTEVYETYLEALDFMLDLHPARKRETAAINLTAFITKQPEHAVHELINTIHEAVNIHDAVA